jgi:enamine deaminase RidA (YjgF/YER057c/UK114 family)
MTVELLNPATLHQPGTYSQMAIASGARTVYLSGQLSVDTSGNLVGGDDLAAQTEQAYLNVAAALKAVGGSMADVAKLTVYVVAWSPDKLKAFGAGIRSAAVKGGFDPRRTMTLLGVASLASPEFLVEVEAIAVLDR